MKKVYQPPIFGETIISFLLTEENAEEILGDLAEMFNAHGRQSGLRNAQTWYYFQIIRSTPLLFLLKLSNILERNFQIMSTNLNNHNKSTLWISLIAVIPAMVLIIPGLLQSGLGYYGATDARDALFAAAPVLELLLNPIILMGGLLLAFAMNVFPALSLHFERKPEGLTSTITFKPILLHWVFIGVSFLMVGIILVYAFFENFNPAF